MSNLRGAVVLVLLGLLSLSLQFATEESAQAAQGSCVATERGYRCIYGPFEVGEGENDISIRSAAIPEEGYITGARIAVVDEEGDLVDRHHIHLHHSTFLDPTSPSLLCPHLDGSVLYMSGKERTRMQFPVGYGVHWKNASPEEGRPPYWLLSGMLMGMHPGTEDEVYIRLNLSFEEMEANLTPVRTEFQAVTDCRNSSEYDVLKGSGTDGRYRRTLEFEWPVDARFVWGVGHMHDGGIKLSFRNQTRDESVLTSRALYADPDQPWDLTGTTTWSSQEGLAVSAGDLMRLSVVYNSKRTWRDVMGNLRITFAQ